MTSLHLPASHWDFLTLKQPLPIKSSFVIPPCLWVFAWCRFSPTDALKIFCWWLGNHLSIKSGSEKSSCGFPDSSVGKESACYAGDPSSIPGLGRSPGEWISYPLQYAWASLVAQPVKNLLQCGRSQSNFWVRKICWKRDSLPIPVCLGFPCGSAGKESACDIGNMGSIPGLGRSPGEGKYPLQYSCLENPMYRGAWWVAVQRVA